jgi:hypothetical protein
VSPVYIVWKKRQVQSRSCPRCGAAGHRGCSWIPVVVESLRVGGSPRQVHVLRLPAIRDCCLRVPRARDAWWQEVGRLLARLPADEEEWLVWKLAQKVPLDDNGGDAWHDAAVASHLDAACALLGLARPFSEAEAKKAFRTLAKVHHPDAGGRTDAFQRLQGAYELALKAAG